MTIRIYSGKSGMEGRTIRLSRNSPLSQYLKDIGLEPHNSRKWWIIKREELEAMVYPVGKYLVYASNEFLFEISNEDLQELHRQLPLLLEMDQKTFRILF